MLRRRWPLLMNGLPHDSRLMARPSSCMDLPLHCLCLRVPFNFGIYSEETPQAQASFDTGI